MLSRTTTDAPTTTVPSGDLRTATAPAPTFELSVRQLLASAAAAVTAALLGSRLGVAGTLIGAALASSVTMVAAAVYSHSLATAQYKVKVARGALPEDQDAPTVALPSTAQAWGLAPQPPSVAAPLAAPVSVRSAPTEPRHRMPRWAAAGVGILAASALALLAVTGIEAVRGTPLSGGESGGLSVLGGKSAGSPDTTTRIPAVTESSSVTPSASETPSTPETVTSTVTVAPTDAATTSAPTSADATTSASSSSAPTTGADTSTSPGTDSATTTPPTVSQSAETAFPSDDPRTDRVSVTP